MQNKLRPWALLGYLLGFILFYEPFMLWRSLFSGLLPEHSFTTIHVPCARVPLANLYLEGWEYIGSQSLLFCALLLLGSLLFGPFFCGRLCPAGAFGEYLSKLLPAKYQIDWTKYVPVAPVRYGMLIGFMLSLWAGLPSPCQYCNYYCLEMAVHLLYTGKLLTDAVSFGLTFASTYVLLGLFTVGGRGYCNYFCPVGAVSSLCHMAGRHLPFSYSVQVKEQSCIGCGLCSRVCTMGAVKLQQGKAQVEYSHCITCGQCTEICPKGAISYTKNTRQVQDEK